MESKKYNKLVSITKEKQTHREDKPMVTSGEREGGEGQQRDRGVRDTNY